MVQGQVDLLQGGKVAEEMRLEFGQPHSVQRRPLHSLRVEADLGEVEEAEGSRVPASAQRENLQLLGAQSLAGEFLGVLV